MTHQEKLIKDHAVDFFKWANTMVLAESNVYNRTFRAHPQAPDYKTYLIYSDNGKLKLSPHFDLTPEEVYEYWQTEILLKYATPVELTAKVYTKFSDATSASLWTPALSLYEVEKPNGEVKYVAHRYVDEFPFELKYTPKKVSDITLQVHNGVEVTLAIAPNTNVEYVDLNTLPIGYYTDSHPSNSFKETRVFKTEKGKTYLFNHNKGEFELCHDTLVLKAAIQYFPKRHLNLL